LFGLGVCSRLADNVAKAFGREVGPDDNKAFVIETHEAWVGEDSSLEIIEGLLGGICPDWCNGLVYS
jgi:hypothetical protein